MQRVLVIDDDADIREMLEVALFQDGCQVQSVESRDQGLALIINGWIPQLILLDYCMPGMEAEEFIQKLIQLCPKLPRVVMMTAGTAADMRAKRLGVPEVLRKPFSPKQLLLQIEWYST